MDGMLGKQTKNKNWPVRFAILTTGLPRVHNNTELHPFHMKLGVVEIMCFCVGVCVFFALFFILYYGKDALYFYPYKTSDMTKGVIPVSNLTELFDMPKGPGFMSGFFFSITFVFLPPFSVALPNINTHFFLFMQRTLLKGTEGRCTDQLI